MFENGSEQMSKKLEKLVDENSMLWGDDVAEAYHGAAARDMQGHWNGLIKPVLDRHPIDFSRSADFACGYGRNADCLLPLADSVALIDVQQENIEHCRKKYAGNPKVDLVPCNGYDLSSVAADRFTFIYSFDALVHFPEEIIASYMPEFFRVMAPGGYAFLHHSNYDADLVKLGPKGRKDKLGDFRKNPHWRNHMSAALFAGIAKRAGFEIAEQKIHDWGVPDLDCMTVLRKPA